MFITGFAAGSGLGRKHPFFGGPYVTRHEALVALSETSLGKSIICKEQGVKNNMFSFNNKQPVVPTVSIGKNRIDESRWG